MKRMNDHLKKGSPEEVQNKIDEVRESLTHALLFIHAHELDAEAGPGGVDGSYLTDAKDTILEALTDLSAAEAFNASPPQFVVPTKTLLEMRDKAEGKVQS